MRHPQRKHISHSIKSSRVAAGVDTVAVCQMAIEGPSGRLTCTEPVSAWKLLTEG